MKTFPRSFWLFATVLFISGPPGCESDVELTYVPAKPKLSQGHVCTSPLGIQSSGAGWYRTDGEKLSFGGGFGIGKDYVLNVCGREHPDEEFTVEQALVPVRNKGKDDPDYYVCTGSVRLSGRKHSPEERLTIRLEGPHPTCAKISGVFSHKNPKAETLQTAAATKKGNCQRYTDCLCAISDALLAAKGRSNLHTLCTQAKRRVLAAPEDPSCDTGLAMYRKTAEAAYGIKLPAACRQ